MKKVIICTLCPNGCEVTVEYTDREDAVITGNRCDRGTEYTVNECFDPKRTFTGNVYLEGSSRKRMPVRSSSPIPKDKMMECAEFLKSIRLEAPVKAGHTVVENIFGSGADIVTAMSIGRDQ